MAQPFKSGPLPTLPSVPSCNSRLWSFPEQSLCGNPSPPFRNVFFFKCEGRLYPPPGGGIHFIPLPSMVRVIPSKRPSFPDIKMQPSSFLLSTDAPLFPSRKCFLLWPYAPSLSTNGKQIHMPTKCCAKQIRSSPFFFPPFSVFVWMFRFHEYASPLVTVLLPLFSDFFRCCIRRPWQTGSLSRKKFVLFFFPFWFFDR